VQLPGLTWSALVIPAAVQTQEQQQQQQQHSEDAERRRLLREWNGRKGHGEMERERSPAQALLNALQMLEALSLPNDTALQPWKCTVKAHRPNKCSEARRGLQAGNGLMHSIWARTARCTGVSSKERAHMARCTGVRSEDNVWLRALSARAAFTTLF